MPTGPADRINTLRPKASGPNFHSHCGIPTSYQLLHTPYFHKIP
jgi:hypothetical protein